MSTFRNVVAKLARNEEGAALVEYGLLIGLIALVCIAAITSIGTKIAASFNKVETALP